jgi:lysophospholipase L1-like esterase
MDVAAAMASDGFHPGPPAYALWAVAAAERIRRSG